MNARRNFNVFELAVHLAHPACFCCQSYAHGTGYFLRLVATDLTSYLQRPHSCLT